MRRVDVGTDDRPNLFYFGNTSGDSAECRRLCREEAACAAYAHHNTAMSRNSAWRGLKWTILIIYCNQRSYLSSHNYIALIYFVI